MMDNQRVARLNDIKEKEKKYSEQGASIHVNLRKKFNNKNDEHYAPFRVYHKQWINKEVPIASAIRRKRQQ